MLAKKQISIAILMLFALLGMSTRCLAQSLPTGWSDSDVGPTGIAGSATYANGVFTVQGGGTDYDFASTTDAFHFVSQPLTGDATIIARVVSTTGTYNFAGVMIRETLQSQAIDATTSVTSYYSGTAYAIFRTTTGGYNNTSNTAVGALPGWVKLVRSGNTFTSYNSYDGIYWQQVASPQTIAMAQNAFVGLVGTSGVNGALGTAIFDHVSITTSAITAPSLTSVSATTGSIGSQVTITGSGFGSSQGSSILYLNTSTATINSWADTSITFTVPTGATSGLLSILEGPSMNSSNAIEFQVTTNPLPNSWLNQDVGPPNNVGLQGSATYSSGIFTLNAACLGPRTAGDSMHFVYRSISGDGTIVARIKSLTVSLQVDAIVTIRQSLNPSDPQVSEYYYPNQSYFLFRASSGGALSSQNTGPGGLNPPYWIKIDRTGNALTGFISTDGVYWSPVGPAQTVPMGTNVEIGLGLSSGSTTSLTTATFDNVSVSTPASPAPSISNLSSTTGSIGGQITISGAGFGTTQGSSKVYLNDLAVTINSWSSGSIKITVPSGASSGPLVVALAPSMNSSNPVEFEVTTQPLPTQWQDEDIGNPGALGLIGSATYSNGTFSVTGAGTGYLQQADSIHFVFQPLSGDGSITARVVGCSGGSACAPGTMIRESLNPGAADIFAFFIPNTVDLYYRPTTGAASSSQYASLDGPAFPYWVRITRAGNVLTGYGSLDGFNWVQAGPSQTIPMAQTVYAGLANTSDSVSSLSTATFDSVSISSSLVPQPAINSLSATTGNIGAQFMIYGSGFNASQGSSEVRLNGKALTINSWSATAIKVTIPTGTTTGLVEVLVGSSKNASNGIVFTITTQPLPSAWLDADIGSVGLAGSATYASGVFTIKGAGSTGFWTTVDSFHYVYQPLSGDGTIVARLTGESGATSSSMVGVVMRETLAAGSSDAVAFDYGNVGDYIYRSSTGASPTWVNGSLGFPPYPCWLKVARVGNTFAAYASLDGVTWSQISTTQTITMAQTIYVGLGASNYSGTSLVTATFDNVSVTAGTMPIITSMSPASGGTNASVTVGGQNFGASQGTSSIKFNGTAATTITSWVANQIVAKVPSAATTGPVMVVVGSIPSNTNFNFTVYHPIITSITPPSAQVGSLITIAGTGFGLSQGDSTVKINGVVASIGAWSDTSLQVVVPTTTTGTFPAIVTVGGVASNSVNFTVLEALSITSISPNTGLAGAVVTITGTGFGGTQSNSVVDFYGSIAAIKTWSDTQIQAYVPTNAASGTVDVQVGGGYAYGPQFAATRAVHLTDSKSNSSTYTSILIGGAWVALQGQGSGCSTCTERGNISYTYDATGHVLSRTDENGHATTYTYDSYGNVHTVTVPINSTTTATTTYTYNSFGEVLTSTDPLGNVTINTYDSNGNLQTLTTPSPTSGVAASVTQFAYNSLGELTTITDPLNNQTTLAYFPTGLIQTITDAQSNVTTYAYDAHGNRSSVTDANSKQTTFAYDSMDRLTKITYPDTTTAQFGYDYRGRRTTVTDQNNKVTTYAYDDADRLITVTDAGTNVTTYGYDTENNLTSIKDANNNTTSFTYDPYGRVTQTNFPSSHIEMYGYDNVGNLTSKTDRKNQQITYTYDQLNRLTQKSYPDTTAVNYTYDNDSRLTQVSDPTGTYGFTFDNMGRLSATTTNYAFLTGRSFTTAYAYDAASNRTGFTDPESGLTTYVYDTLNRLQTLTPPSAFTSGSFGFGYDVLSRRTSLTRPNTLNTTYGYDNLSRLLSVTHAKSGTTLDGASYGLDNAGNRASRTPLPGATATNFTYDNIYELLTATQGATTMESYTYDPVGNRLSNLAGSGWNNNTSNELTTRPGLSYTYDFNGNTLTMVNSTGTSTYSWDFENRLSSVTLPGTGGTVNFKYDPMGRRIYKSSSSGTSIYAYDLDTLAEETNSSGVAIARYTQSGLIDEPLAMLRGGVTSYYEADGIGSVTSLSNAAGSVAQSYTFDSFGNQTGSSGSLTNSFRYTGRELDTETNLQFSRARYYDSNTGRFISEDPIRFGGGISFYPYVGNQPTNFSDPSGLNRQQIGPPTKKYNCLAWGLGLNWVWVQPADGTSPNGVMPQFGCKKIDCDKDVNCQQRSKVKVLEDSGDPHNWHVERQTCDKGWTSKYGQGPLFDHIDNPDADYGDVYKPKGKTKATCWSCPVVPPTALPKSPSIQYIQ